MHPKDLRPLPLRTALGGYHEQASALLKAFRLGDPAALVHIRRFHPRLPGRANTNDRNPITREEIKRAKVTLADAEAVVAGWNGFANWQALSDHVDALNRRDSLVLPFELAVEAIIHGRMATLRSLLRKHPALIHARSTREHRATLLHYVGANGVEGYRQRTPANAVAVAKLLLRAGAEVDADLDYGAIGHEAYRERTGSTTLGLVATSFHPAAAGVQILLMKVLLAAGASPDGLPDGWNPLLAALHNGRGEAARYLAMHGARLDLEGAAGTGRLDVVQNHFDREGRPQSQATQAQLEAGLMWASEYGHKNVVAFLVSTGVDVAVQPHGETALHWASYGGHPAIVDLLVKSGAPLESRDHRFGGTPLGWALHGCCYPPPEAKRANYPRVVQLLLKAGAQLEEVRNVSPEQVRMLRANARMLEVLRTGHPRVQDWLRRKLVPRSPK